MSYSNVWTKLTSIPPLADFMEEDEVAQIVVCRLLNTINDLREDLEKEKRAQ
jgi:hypothetical protein